MRKTMLNQPLLEYLAATGAARHGGPCAAARMGLDAAEAALFRAAAIERGFLTASQPPALTDAARVYTRRALAPLAPLFTLEAAV